MRGNSTKRKALREIRFAKNKRGGGGGADGQTDSKSIKVTTYYFWRLRDPKLNAYNGCLTSIYT